MSSTLDLSIAVRASSSCSSRAVSCAAFPSRSRAFRVSAGLLDLRLLQLLVARAQLRLDLAEPLVSLGRERISGRPPRARAAGTPPRAPARAPREWPPASCGYRPTSRARWRAAEASTSAAAWASALARSAAAFAVEAASSSDRVAASSRAALFELRPEHPVLCLEGRELVAQRGLDLGRPLLPGGLHVDPLAGHGGARDRARRSAPAPPRGRGRSSGAVAASRSFASSSPAASGRRPGAAGPRPAAASSSAPATCTHWPSATAA